MITEKIILHLPFFKLLLNHHMITHLLET
uniref:Uncharacterized protein n=1 Tax=Amphimedon queenslandica TaxID=400682 RepID=A0A1X7UCU2_AMPQE